MAITVITDDEDSSIQYLGKWHSNYSDASNNHTVHATSDANAQAIFKFKGSSVSVFGSIQRTSAFAPTASFRTDNLPPTIFVGKASEVDNLARQHLYTSPALDPSKEHTLVIEVTKIIKNAFWIDYFEVVQEEDRPNTPNIPAVLAPPQTTPLNNPPSPPTSVTPLFSSSSTVLTGMSSTIIPSPLAASAASSSPGSYPPGLNSVPNPTTATVTATQTQSSSPQSLGNRSNSAIIGAAVGGAVGGLVIIIALLYILRRRAKAKMQLQSSRQATAFSSMASPITSTSESLSKGYESGSGYVVRSGLSREKTVGLPSNEEWQVSNTWDGGDPGLEQLPAYESDYGDTMPLRRKPK